MSLKNQAKTALRDLIGADQPPDARRGALWGCLLFAGGYLWGRADAARGVR